MDNAPLARRDTAALDRPGAAQLDGWIAAWLDAKTGRSGSARTRRNYADTLGWFRAALQDAGLDLDSPAGAVALALEQWAARDTPQPATYNHRLAVLSSFYSYVAKKHGAHLANPADRVERRKVESYRAAAGDVLPAATLRQRLAAIDRTTDQGARDYALLRVALTTARRLAELAGLRWGDVTLDGDRVTLRFRTKGDKTAHNVLPARDAAPLLAWLHRYYGATLGDLAPDAPIWPALTGPTKGAALKTRAIAYIVEDRLRTHPHALRAQLAQAMDAAGARPRDIQAALGHSSVQTTERYLDALRRNENPYAGAVADLLFGEGE